MNCCHLLKPIILVCFCCIGIIPALASDSDSLFLRELELLRDANQAFCKGDTARTVKSLEAIAYDFPKNTSASIASGRLAAFYLAGADTVKALAILEHGLKLQAENGFPQLADSCGLLHKANYETIKADLCVAASTIHAAQGNKAAAFHFLALADSTYLPYRNCGNGAIMYRTKLSLNFADYYLQNGDTMSAISRLIAYFLSGEAYSRQVTLQLKTLLLNRYTQREIRRSVKAAIRCLCNSSPPGIDTEMRLEMRLFGQTVPVQSHQSLRKTRAKLRDDDNIRLLLQ